MISHLPNSLPAWHFTSADPVSARGFLAHSSFAKDFDSLLAEGRLERMWQDADCLHEACLLARDEAGAVIACGLVNSLPLADGTRQALVRLAVHPGHRRRGLGSALLEEITTRLQAVNSAGEGSRIALLALFAVLPCDDAAGFAERHGFVSVRHFHRMERGAGAVPEPVWPEGITLRAFDGSEEMLAAWLTAYNEGMASHFRFTPGVLDDCREIAAAPGFLTEHVQVAFADARPVGLLRISLHEEPGTFRGEVDILAVAPEHRGRGLGRALLRHGLRLLRSSGATRFRLIVDAEGPVAPGLYRAEGFVTAAVRQHWERAL